MEEDDASCFAQLVPVNSRARSLFADAVTKAQSKGNELYLRFYADKKLRIRADGSAGVIDPQEAYAQLSLDPSRLPQIPKIGWRVGKESRGVDICIATTGIEASLRFRLFINQSSGLLVLETGSSTRYRMGYANASQELVHLAPMQQQALLRPINHIELAGCEFQVRYTVSESRQEPFFRMLDDFLKVNHNKDLHQAARINPSTGLRNTCGKYLVGGSLGFGAYGDVKYGVDEDTGDPVALKDVRIMNGAWRQELRNEVNVLEELKDSDYFLHIVRCWCDMHNKHPKDCPGNNVEHFYIATELALYNFCHPIFLRDVDYDKILQLYHQTLLGIQHLRQKGIMHRDISQANMFVVRLEPPRAVIGDFGKAVRSLKHTGKLIGPKVKCAPEVWSRKEKESYSSAIDLWSWAYAAAEHLGYAPRKEDYYNAIDLRRLAEIHRFLDDKATKEPHTAPLVDLLSKILVWDARYRIGLQEALDHDVWKNISSLEAEAPGSQESVVSKKRQKKNSSASPGNLSSTEVISEAT